MIWWTARYFKRISPNAKMVYNSEMIPFSLLPYIIEVNNKFGHKFNTNQIQIEVGPVKIHMPTNSIWINDKDPIYVEDGSRIILYKKNYMKSPEKIISEIMIGLVNEMSYGVTVLVSENNTVIDQSYSPHLLIKAGI